MQIWKDKKITTYNLSYAVMKPQEAYFDLKRAFKTQSPKTVFVESQFMVETESDGFDYFTTVMTISPQKSSPILNAIGAELETHHKTPYFYSDFKKKGGIDKGVTIRNQYGLYYQDYCGCEASLAARKKQ